MQINRLVSWIHILLSRTTHSHSTNSLICTRRQIWFKIGYYCYKTRKSVTSYLLMNINELVLLPWILEFKVFNLQWGFHFTNYCYKTLGNPWPHIFSWILISWCYCRDFQPHQWKHSHPWILTFLWHKPIHFCSRVCDISHYVIYTIYNFIICYNTMGRIGL